MMPATDIKIAACLKTTTIVRDIIQTKTVLYINTTAMMPATDINIAACLKTTTIVKDIIQMGTVIYIYIYYC